MEEMGISVENLVKGQGVFVGRYAHSLDPKKRLTIPSGWRAQVGDPKGLYVLPDFHQKCLNVMPAKALVQRMDRFRQNSLADRKAREVARTLGAQSDLVTWDTQGRMRIKDELLEYAGLVDRVELIGALDCFELWNPDHLREAVGKDQMSLPDAARYVGL